MTFFEWYEKNHNKGHEFVLPEQLPKDVYDSLKNEIECDNKRIGKIIFHSHESENGKVVFKGLKIGYYVRRYTPEIIWQTAYIHIFARDFEIPYISCIKWWKWKRVQ